jgi:hypothetical protein
LGDISSVLHRVDIDDPISVLIPPYDIARSIVLGIADNLIEAVFDNITKRKFLAVIIELAYIEPPEEQTRVV